MKKQKLKSLKLNKKSISNFNSSTVHGGSGACGIESVRICEAPITDTCSINNVACNTGGTTGSASPSVHCSDECYTQIPADCNVDTGTPSIFPNVC
ncbi:hypothetical protein H2O64_13310 [Kordia sp. YSTF-M3]|uniref:Uncharacterized protein n=1 Tax=Kordia aestuariivivens TaxID=2759037 RepID=A0ABR7QAQ3_9FLAO|nr:hypothetical protein [Kordia aestuariivivens]MBC8755650.1 hypothetical protein [Kordia aestuariivivens]